MSEREIQREIMDALKQAARRGVRVHLVLDGFGSHEALRTEREALARLPQKLKDLKVDGVICGMAC